MAPQLVAYIDPMSGSLAVQCLVAVAVSASLFFRRVLVRPFTFIGKALSFRKVKTQPEPSHNAP